MSAKEESIDLVKLSDIKIHKLAEMHRVMSDKEFNSLVDSIQTVGQLVPVITYKGRIVDGRHRYHALTELGETHIKVSKLPGNISLREVRKRIQGTEMRRADNVMQKSIRAYKDMLEGNGLTQEETCVKFGVSRDTVGAVRKLHDMRGIDFIEVLYQNGKVVLGGKTYTQVKQIVKFFKEAEIDRDRNYEAPTEILAEHYKSIEDLSNEELILLSIRCKKIAAKRESE